MSDHKNRLFQASVAADTVQAKKYASKETAMMVALEHEDEFKSGFRNWLDMNYHVYAIFEQHALAIGRRRDHYSARTIIEHMRFDEDVREDKELSEGFKLNNNGVPDMARLFVLINPIHRELFSMRLSPLRQRLISDGNDSCGDEDAHRLAL